MPPVVVLRDKPALTPIIALPVLATLTSLILFLLVAQLIQRLPLLLSATRLLFFLVVAITFLRAALDLVTREFSHYALTQTHLLGRYDLLHRDEFDIPLTNIQDITIKQPLAGMLLDYGTLRVTTAGSSFKLYYLPHPRKWRQEIDSRRRP